MKCVKGILPIFCFMGLLSATTTLARAEDLAQVYMQAIANDPAFAKAHATWLSQKMNLLIAKSSILPQLTITGNSNRNYTYLSPPTLSTIRRYNWTYGDSIKMTDALFDMAAWASVRSAKAIVKSATASFLAAQQSLMQRTTKAYFSVMKAYETLHYTLANKVAVEKQYSVAQRKYKTGLIAIMDVYDARSRLDQVASEEITARNNLSVELENLRTITGHYYTGLQGLNKQLTLLKPKPNDLDAWVNLAEKQNYNVQAQYYNVIAAMEKVKQQGAGYAPTVDLSTGMTEAQAVDNQRNRTTSETISLGFNLTYKPIQGGFTYAAKKQARYNYVAACSELKAVRRQVQNQARTAYISIIADIKHVETDRQRIVSARQALTSTEAGLKVGTRTMVDVLNDLGTVYQSERQYTDDQYTYLNDVIDLKIAAGTLSPNDIVAINTRLTRKIIMPATSL